MADEHEGAAHTLQLRFQPLDGRQVEVVGGLVEEQDVGLGRQRLGERDPPPLTARQALRVFRPREPQALQEVAGAVGVVVVVQAGFHEIQRRLET